MSLSDFRAVEFFLCDCMDPEHQFIISYEKDIPNDVYDDPFVTVTVHLPHTGFFRRLMYACKYLFGYKSKMGAFCEILLDKTTVVKIVDHLNTYLKIRENNN